MSNNSNYIQATENVQQITKKYWSYLYELRHISTGFLYVGSRSNQKVLKKFEDCYTDDYLGTSSKEEGPFSEKDTKTNPQDYAKTVLKVFHDEDPKKATRYEHGSNGLIMTYWKIYGKDKVLNQHCVLNDGSKVFSTAGNTFYVNKTEEEKQRISQKLSDAYNNKTEEEKAIISQKKSKALSGENNPMFGKNSLANKTEEEILEIRQKQSKSLKGKNKGKNPYANKTEAEMTIIKTKMSISNSKPKIKYYCPHDRSIQRDGGNLAQYIKKNYPNEKQWSDFTKEEKESYLVVSQDDSGLIAN